MRFFTQSCRTKICTVSKNSRLTFSVIKWSEFSKEMIRNFSLWIGWPWPWPTKQSLDKLQTFQEQASLRNVLGFENVNRIFVADRVDVPMDGTAWRANSRQQRCLRPHCQEKSLRNVLQFRFRESDIPVRRPTEEVSVGSVREVDELESLTWGRRKNLLRRSA